EAGELTVHGVLHAEAEVGAVGVASHGRGRGSGSGFGAGRFGPRLLLVGAGRGRVGGWGRQGWWRHEPVGRARRSERRGEEQGEEVSAGHGRGCARASQSPHAPHTLWRIGGALCALAYGVAWWRASRVGGRVAVVLGVVTFGACRVLVISTSSSSASPAHMT